MGAPQRSRQHRLSLFPCVILGLCGGPTLSACAPSLGAEPALLRVTVGRFAGSAAVTPAPTAPQGNHAANAVDLVESTLRRRGLRFGTDGTPGGLLAYVSHRHRLIPSTQARPGDVVFFDLGSGRCGDHVGLVESRHPGGRLTFREIRDGEARTSLAHPGRPTDRRDEDGLVLNTFLRPRRPEDPRGARYFAGDMLCAVGRLSLPEPTRRTKD